MTLIPETPSAIRLIQISRLVQGGKWRVEAMRSLREPVLLWFTQGQGRITVAGTTRGYGPHQAVFLPPGVMHGFEMAARVQGMALYFGREHGLDLPDQPQFLRPKDAVTQKELIGLLENIQRELESQRPGAQRAAKHHLGLLGVWIERQLERDQAAGDLLTARSPAAQRLAARYAALIERDFRSNRSVADFALALGVTPTHLTRACRATCGKGAHGLLEDRILFEARRLLSETRMPIKDVAQMLGFNSAGYFTRAFQKNAGQTPSAFRRRPAAGSPPAAAPAPATLARPAGRMFSPFSR